MTWRTMAPAERMETEVWTSAKKLSSMSMTNGHDCVHVTATWRRLNKRAYEYRMPLFVRAFPTLKKSQVNCGDPLDAAGAVSHRVSRSFTCENCRVEFE